MREDGETVPSLVSELLTPIVTLAVGWELSFTVNVAVPPSSVVLPLMMLTLKPAVSSVVLLSSVVLSSSVVVLSVLFEPSSLQD